MLTVTSAGWVTLMHVRLSLEQGETEHGITATDGYPNRNQSSRRPEREPAANVTEPLG